MKRIVLLFALLCSFTNVSSQCDVNIVLSSQAEVNAFPLNYGCSEIGSLSIGSLFEDSDIHNLDSLYQISVINGALRVRHNPNLVDFSGLSNLSSITWSVEVISNASLMNLSGLENIDGLNSLTIEENESLNTLSHLANLETLNVLKILTNNSLSDLLGLGNIDSLYSVRIEGNESLNTLDLSNLQDLSYLQIVNNASLNNLSGLENIDSVYSMILHENNSLTNLIGLENLTKLHTVEIFLNESLIDLSGLESLTELHALLIHNNLSLSTLSALSNLEKITHRLEIINNPLLNSLVGLEGLSNPYTAMISDNASLTSLAGIENWESLNELEINNNDQLVSLEDLSAFQEIEKISIIDNDLLIDLSGLENLVFEDLYIDSNNALSNLSGLEGLEICETLSIRENESLISLNALANLSSVRSLTINNNDSLSNLSGLENLTQIGDWSGGGLAISQNDLLLDLTGLNNLNSIEGNLAISGNNLLKKLEGLESLTEMGGTLNILNNSALENLEGIEALTEVGGECYIKENENLTSLKGIENLVFVNNIVIIRDNPILETCCGLIPISLVNNSPAIILEGNEFSCNSMPDVVEHCIIDTKIRAQAFFDENQDGSFNQGEQPLTQSFELNPNALYIFNDSEFMAHLYIAELGVYELSLNNIQAEWMVNEAYETIEVSFWDTLISDSIYRFPMTPLLDYTKQNIDLTSSITRCNQNTNYWLSYTNEGTSINSGYVELIVDENTNFVSANPPIDSVSGNYLYWFYEDLYPTHSNQIHLIYEMPSVDFIGEDITFEASIETLDGNGDDKTSLSSELICAYDPNDKLNNPSGYGDANYTLFEDTLEYTIRFQNTGNDTAFVVVIEDELSEHLNLNTFRPIASSHNVETQIDIENRIAIFTFKDIYLPDSFVNEPASHGFVKYQIVANDGLNEETEITNTASIFFDENPSIITNTTSNRMVSVLPNLPVLAASPASLDFGEILLEDVPFIAPQTLIIQNPGDLPLSITNLFFLENNFTANGVETLSIEGQDNTEILIYFNPTSVGEYQSELILTSNAGDFIVDLSGKVVFETGLSSLASQGLSIYPNPNEGIFTLKSTKDDFVSIQIQNSLGEIVFEKNNKDSTQNASQLLQIDLSAESKGLYFISVETEEGSFVDKIVVQ